MTKEPMPLMLNSCRLTGDLAHLFGSSFLLLSLLFKRSARGVSAKTQILYLMIYLTRYYDLSAIFINAYATFKFTFVIIYFHTCFLILVPLKKTYQQRDDAFMSEIVVFASIIAAVFNNYDGTQEDIMWAFSQYLEEVVLLPQFFIIVYSRKITFNVLIYIISIGAYQFFYCVNWLFVYTKKNYTDPISSFSAVAFMMLLILYSMIMYYKGVKLDRDQDFLKTNICVISQPAVVPKKDVEKEILIQEKY